MSEPLLSKPHALIAASPVLSALCLYGLAHDRWLVAGPLVLGVLAAVFTGTTIERRPWHLLVALAVGGGLGFLVLFRSETPPSAFPPWFLSPFCGALACLAAFVVVAQRYMYSWIYGWLLAAFCFNVAPFGAVWITFLALLLSTLACCFVLTGGARLRWAGALGFLGFVALLSVGAFGLTRLAMSSEEALTSVFLRWARDLDSPSGLGLNSEVYISDQASVELSARPVLELDGTPPSYLRTMVLEKFDGVVWSDVSGPRGRGYPNTSVAQTPRIEPPPDQQRKQTMLLREPLDDVIPAPAGTYNVKGTASRQEHGWVWRTIRTIHNVIELDHSAYERLPPEPQPSPIDTELPNDKHGDLKALLLPYARQIVTDAKTPREMADRISRFFQSQFYYSLHTDLRGDGPPLVVFIREHRPAYCIYFASGMAALLRSLGVPARLVTGFVPMEVNPVDGRTIVRLRDAHAWVEVYLPDEGRFVAFDPTPARSREEALGVTKPGWLSNVWQAMGSALRRAWIAFREDPAGTIVAILRSPFVAVPVCGFAVLQLLRRRRQGPVRKQQRALESEDAALRAAYRRYLKLLARAGIVPTRAETDEELLQRLAEVRGPQVSQAAVAFLEAYRRERYAQASSRRELPGLLKQFEQELRKAA